MIVSDQLVTALATAAFPSLVVLIGVLVSGQRLNRMVLNMDARSDEADRHIDGWRDQVLAGLRRMQEVIDARLKHLEEHLPG